jgi:HK97 gp10 family phage protein
MPDGISIEVTGLKELQLKLDALTTKQANLCIRKALRAGGLIEKAAVEERAPVKDEPGGYLPAGALKADIIVHTTKDEQGAISAIVGPGKLTAHVARWVEYGHRMIRGGRSRLLPNGKTRGPGKQIGFVDAHPFIRPAYEATRQEVISTICTTLTTELEKAGNTKGTT